MTDFVNAHGLTETSSLLDSGGRLRSRDLCRSDQHSYVYVEGRTDDVTIRGTQNISPAEIEAIVEQHP